MEHIPENAIHVTGFGVFRGFTSKNPSWEAVSQLPDHIEHNGQTIPIVKHQVPVTYEAVDKKVHEIWSTKPKVSTIIFVSFPLLFSFLNFHSYFSLWCIVVLIKMWIKFVWNETHLMENSIKPILQINV